MKKFICLSTIFSLSAFLTTPVYSEWSESLNCETFDGKFKISKPSGNYVEKSYYSTVEQSLVSCKENIAVAIMGNYFSYSDGSSIKDSFVGISSDEKTLKIASGYNSASAIMGNYFIAVTNGEILKEFIGISSDEKRLQAYAGRNISGAIMGNYFITANNGSIQKEYIGISNDEKVKVAISDQMIAAIAGNYFIITDGKKINKEF